MNSLGLVDVAFAAVVGVSVLIGAWRGLVFELMSLAGWVVAYMAAASFGPSVAPALPIGEPGSALNHAAAFVAVFIGAWLGWALLSRGVRLLIAATPLTVPDRLLGAGFGLLRAVVVLTVVATAVSLTPAAKSPAWQGSQGASFVGLVLRGLLPVLPPGLARWLPRP